MVNKYKRTLYKVLYQMVANFIMNRLKMASSEHNITYWYSMGIRLDNMAKSKNISLK